MPRTVVIAAAVVAVAGWAVPLGAQDSLRVLRVSPGDTARPSSTITVMFDRPIAASLDSTVSAARVFRVSPATRGFVSWRDPITIRFVPATPLEPGVRYTITIDTSLRAGDGTRLGGATQFTFRVAGPTLLARSFNRFGGGDTLAPDGHMHLLYSAPVDLDRLARAVRLELSGCRGARSIMVRPTGQHPPGDSDPPALRSWTRYPPDSIGDRFRTIVELEPAETPPLECAGFVVIPTTDDDARFGREERYRVTTAPAFRVIGTDCTVLPDCGGLGLRFSTRVKIEDMRRLVRVNDQPIVVRGDRAAMVLRPEVLLVTRSTYTFQVDSSLRDTYGRPVEGQREWPVRVDDYAPALVQPTGIMTIPRSGPLTLPIRSVNVRSLRIIAYRIPDSLRVAAMTGVVSYYESPVLRGLRPETTLVTLPDQLNADTTVDVPLPPMALAPDHPLVIARVVIADSLPDIVPRLESKKRKAIVLGMPAGDNLFYWRYSAIQVTDLAITARLVGETDGSALVTGLGDGRPRSGVTVSEFDRWHRAVGRGTTDDRGVARLARVMADSAPRATPVSVYEPRYAVLEAHAGDDRVLVTLGGRMIGYRSGSPLDVASLGGRREDAPLAAGAVFADRGIYRPGEILHVKGIVRRGALGELALPAASDSARIVVRRVDDSWFAETTLVVRDTVKRVSAFGTVIDSAWLRPGLRLGRYAVDVRVVAPNRWRTVGSTEFRIEEYRAPDFVVEARNDTTIRYHGDTIVVDAHAQLLFGTPLRGGKVRWSATMDEGEQPRPRHITADWSVGGGSPFDPPAASMSTNGVAMLDAAGNARLRIPVAALTKSLSGSAELSVGITDVDQQAVSSTASGIISSSRLYILARAPRRAAWLVGSPVRIDVRTVNENGDRIREAHLHVVTVRRRLKRADPVRDVSGAWVIDTVVDRPLTLAGGEGTFTFTPDSGGEYAVVFSGRDSRSGVATTSVVAGVRPLAPPPRPPREIATGFRLMLTTDSAQHAVGDVVRVHFDSPFRDAEAWIAVEREGMIDQRRQRASAGDNTFDVRITDRFVPNVFVSVVLAARGETARPDSARQRMRAGYLELTVKPSRKNLTVSLSADRSSYSPRDTAAIRIHVGGVDGRGVRSELAVWAVDEGVISLTAFQTPDLRSQIFRSRGVGADLWSTIPTLLTADPGFAASFLRQAVVQLQEVVYSGMSATLGATISGAPTLRSNFSSTAFYLGQVLTDDRGDAVARAPVPDNLTTFRVMAVAVSGDDRYGHGDTTLLVTRPLVARAALPRFVRPTDSLVAGVVVTARDGRPRAASADASVEGAALRGPARVNVSLVSTASSEARFIIKTPARDATGDTIFVQLGAADGVTADATLTKLPVRPDFHPRTHAVIGAVRDSSTVTLTLPAEIDPVRSRMRLRVGTSRLSAMLAAYRWLRAYPYDCTEQLSSVGRGIIAVWRATRTERRDALGGDPHAKLQEIADEISRRQAPNGSIKYWPTLDWSTPWLTSYAGLFLLDARDEGVKVDPSVIVGILRYLDDVSRAPVDTGGMNRYEQRQRRLTLGERVATVDFLRRAGEADTATERSLMNAARAMTWEDRLHLAEVIAPRRDMRIAAESLVDDAWRAVTPAGHRVDLPDSSHGPRAFPSRIAPAARLLSASLALRPTHPLLGGLIETVLQHGRAEAGFAWSTQDYASVVMAFAAFNEGADTGRIVGAYVGSRRFVAHPAPSGIDTTIATSLDGMLETTTSGTRVLRVHVDASQGQRPVYYSLEVDEVPLAPPVKPDIQGIVVERWYERFDNGAPVTQVEEGDLVRVRLRVTVPADREFVALEDPLPAGLEPINIGLRTSGLGAFSTAESERATQNGDRDRDGPFWQMWLYGGWDDGHWSPWEYRELHDDRVSYFTRMLWTGSYTASYVARATTAGSFVAPPAYAEEMYNPALQGRSAGGRFNISTRP